MMTRISDADERDADERDADKRYSDERDSDERGADERDSDELDSDERYLTRIRLWQCRRAAAPAAKVDHRVADEGRDQRRDRHLTSTVTVTLRA